MKTMKKGTQVIIKHIIGETAEKVLKKLDGENVHEFTVNAFVDDSEPCKGGFFHLRQAREFIPGKKLGNDNVKFWPRLRTACHKAGTERVNVPGGNIPFHYDDEVVIPDFKVSGSHFFVVKKEKIGDLLALVPLDEAGKRRAEQVACDKAAAAAEAHRQATDPKCIARRIGQKLWSNGAACGGPEREFERITFQKGDIELSVIYPTWTTNFFPFRGVGVAKVVNEHPANGLEYLDGRTAGTLDPRKHNRIKKIDTTGRGDLRAYLMPDPALATETREGYRFLDLFDNADNDGINPALIAEADFVTLEVYDLHDNLIPWKLTYSRETGDVTCEDNRNK